MATRPRVAVLSPFLDKQHGTERCVAEQVERLAEKYEIHLYSTRVQDVDLSRVVWHRVPALLGPHLGSYLWWFAANHLRRWWERRFRGVTYDVVYTPGINCLDADVISVHIVFAKFHQQVREELSLRSNPLAAWPRLMHRRLYYRLVRALENRVYTRQDLKLAVISRVVAEDLAEFFGRKDHLDLIYYGWGSDRFNPQRRARLRVEARRALELRDEIFAVLLIGNDWKKKGLPCLLEAVGQLPDPRVWVMVVGTDMRAPYQLAIRRNGLGERVRFLPPRPDVEFYYAAADAYAGPSLEDAFALPPAEAMACGLPAIVSIRAGVSELITDGVDGLILKDPRDARSLAGMILSLHNDSALRQRLGDNAARTAQEFSWDRNARELETVFEEVLRKKGTRGGESPSSEQEVAK
jgi:glycosyltransferase involved in cell wall biosynthesis